MKYLEILVGLWFKAGLVIFLAAFVTTVALLVAARPWLILIGLAIALIIHIEPPSPLADYYKKRHLQSHR